MTCSRVMPRWLAQRSSACPLEQPALSASTIERSRPGYSVRTTVMGRPQFSRTRNTRCMSAIGPKNRACRGSVVSAFSIGTTNGEYCLFFSSQFVVPIENALTTDPVQAMFCGPIADMQRVLRVLENCGLPITVVRTEYPGRDLSIVDVLNAGCSKGHALERWANFRGITREQVMAVGDNYNDIEMLAFAGP